MALVSDRQRAEAAVLAREIRHVELMSLSGYQELFLAAIPFPG